MMAIKVWAPQGYAFRYTPHAPEMVRVPESTRRNHK
jgi:hypothetical protein